jgi:aminomethyltransferase
MSADNLRKTPLNAWHRSQGAKMVDFAGWDMPVQYPTGILEEHLATRKFGALFDISHMGRFRIRGRDRVPFLQHVLSNNVEALQPWQAQYTLIPDQAGAVIDDAYLYRFGDDDYLLVVNASNREKDWAHFQEHVADFQDVLLEDHTERLAMVAFQGPLTGRILASRVEDGRLPEPAKNELSEIHLCGTRILVARTGYTGEPIGFELFVPTDKAGEVWSALDEAGRVQSLVPAGLGARDTLRLEAGLPLYGHEFGVGPEGRPFPAFAFPLTGVAVSFSERKGDFVGRAALRAQFEQVQKLRTGHYEHSDILPRRTRCLALLDKGVIRQGHEVFIGERKVGAVTSGTVTPFWKLEGEGAAIRITDESNRRAIALACLDATLKTDQEVEVVVRNNRLKARIVSWHGRSDAPPYFRPMPVGWSKPEPLSPIRKGLQKAELLLRRSLENHEWRQRRCINLIPSEMTPSPLVRLLQVTDPVGRYAEHRELLASFGREVYYYQGTDFIAWVEDRLEAQMCDFLGCPLAEVRTVSGQMANVTVFSALVDYKHRIDRRSEPARIRLAIHNHLSKGGHLSAQPTGALRDYVARDPVTERPAVISFPVCKDNPYRIDLEATARLLERVDPELIIFGKSMVLHPEPVSEVRKLVKDKKHRPILMYDMAHVLGLVGPHFQEPFSDGADIVTGSTHKTFFGTQRGIIGANFHENTPEFDLWQAVRRRAFPGMLSNHHLGTLLGQLLATIEMNTFKDQYQPQVIRNAKAFARALSEAGIKVEGDPAVDFTETHQVIVNVGYAKGCEAARQLERNNIIVNYQAIPGDESFTSSSGLRLGVSEMTRFGMKEPDFQELASLFADAVRNGSNVAEKVAEFRSRFRAMQYCFDDEALEPLKKRLLETF